jgi:hypothetical protein
VTTAPPAPPATGPLPPAAPHGAPGGVAGPQTSRSVSPTAADVLRRWRVPIALVALIVLGGALAALLQPTTVVTGYLDPADTSPTGTHALADILASRGYTVTREVTPAAAEAAVEGTGPPGATLVITSPGLLTAAQLRGLARVRADLVLVGPDPATLAAFAPGVRAEVAAGVQVLPPGCRLPAARLAGTADMGGLTMAPDGVRATALCYPLAGGDSLVQYESGGRLVTLLGTGNLLSNGSLGQQGNAALALNLLAARPTIVWLVPGPGLAASSASGGQQSLWSLIPLPAYLVAIQLGVVVLLAALWRVRRLGRLVPEPLPVVVRASETVEGLASLYRSRRARDRAAAALRAATLARTLPVLGLASGARPPEVISAVSARSGSDLGRVQAMLFGPTPADDAALVALAGDLDTLERKVRGL